jgi:ABC-type spermidine/putrescine transport system permease subunit I
MTPAPPLDRASRGRVAALVTPGLLLLVLGLIGPIAFMVRLSFCRGGGQSGFGIGGHGFYEPGTFTFAAYRTLLGDGYFRDVAWFTVWFALLVAVVTVAIAGPVALLIDQLGRRFGPRVRLGALVAVTLPKLANVLVVVYGLELMLGNVGPVNRLLAAAHLVDHPVELLHDLAGTLIGKVYLLLPYAILALVAGLDRIDPALVAAARGLGAGPVTTFRRVTLPLALPSIGLAFGLSLIFALGAFVTPYLLGGPEQITIAVDVQKQTFENLHWPRAAAQSVLVVLALALVGLAFEGIVARARRGRGGEWGEPGRELDGIVRAEPAAREPKSS